MERNEYGWPGVEPATSPHRIRRPGKWTWRLLPLLAVLLMAGTLGGALPAQARSSDQSAPLATSGDVAMTLDCVHLTSRARKYADAHGYCTSGVSPDYSVPANGNCGMTRIDMFQYFIPSWAYFYLQAVSYLGPIASVSYNVQTVNSTTGNVNGIRSFSFNVPPSPYWSTFPGPVGTGKGRVTATFTGSVTLIWGGVCSVLNPYAVETIN